MKLPSQQNYIQQLSIDCVIFGYQEKQLKVLVPKLAFKGDFWALPSGFVFQDEGIDQAAHRILVERTGIKDIFLEQYRVFGDTQRTSVAFMERLVALNVEKVPDESTYRDEYAWFTRRFVSIGYYALVDISKVVPRKVELDESIEWYNIKALPAMIMDHNAQVRTALDTLRKDFDQQLMGFNLLPETFTMKDLQQLYEAVYDRPFRRNNFQKKMLDLKVLERLEKKYTGAANKAPYLYRFIK
ncbi:MAG: NUDIX domain-containing protein [Cyclobacteriaceae bacterium]